MARESYSLRIEGIIVRGVPWRGPVFGEVAWRGGEVLLPVVQPLKGTARWSWPTRKLTVQHGVAPQPAAVQHKPAAVQFTEDTEAANKSPQSSHIDEPASEGASTPARTSLGYTSIARAVIEGVEEAVGLGANSELDDQEVVEVSDGSDANGGNTAPADDVATCEDADQKTTTETSAVKTEVPHIPKWRSQFAQGLNEEGVDLPPEFRLDFSEEPLMSFRSIPSYLRRDELAGSAKSISAQLARFLLQSPLRVRLFTQAGELLGTFPCLPTLDILVGFNQALEATRAPSVKCLKATPRQSSVPARPARGDDGGCARPKSAPRPSRNRPESAERGNVASQADPRSAAEILRRARHGRFPPRPFTCPVESTSQWAQYPFSRRACSPGVPTSPRFGGPGGLAGSVAAAHRLSALPRRPPSAASIYGSSLRLCRSESGRSTGRMPRDGNLRGAAVRLSTQRFDPACMPFKTCPSLDVWASLRRREVRSGKWFQGATDLSVTAAELLHAAAELGAETQELQGRMADVLRKVADTGAEEVRTDVRVERCLRGGPVRTPRTPRDAGGPSGPAGGGKAAPRAKGASAMAAEPAAAATPRRQGGGSKAAEPAEARKARVDCWFNPEDKLRAKAASKAARAAGTPRGADMVAFRRIIDNHGNYAEDWKEDAWQWEERREVVRRREAEARAEAARVEAVREQAEADRQEADRLANVAAEATRVAQERNAIFLDRSAMWQQLSGWMQDAPGGELARFRRENRGRLGGFSIASTAHSSGS